MKKIRIMAVFMVILAILVFGMVTSLCSATVIGGCFVMGGGNLANGDSFGGNVMGMKDGRVRGQWQHYYNDGASRFHGYAEFLFGWNDGGPGPDVPRAYPNRAVFGGKGTWQGQPGYLWIVAIADYKEGKDGRDAALSDSYGICIYRDTDGDGVATEDDEIVYEVYGCIFGGNVQVVPPTQGHPYVPFPPTAEMDRVNSLLPLCTGS
jgi:hypothetical protein